MISAAVLSALIGAAVAAGVVGDARAQRAATGRELLDEGNARLASLGAPQVLDPGPDATGDELLVRAAVAAVRADLLTGVIAGPGDAPAPVPPTVPDEDQGDAEAGDDPGSPPPSTGRGSPSSARRDGPSLVVIPGPPDAPTGRAVPAPARPAPAAPAPAPAPAPRRGVLEPCLLGSILC